MKTITVDESRICAVLAALDGMEKDSAWSPLLIAGMIKSNCKDHCKVTHIMEIKWPVTGAVTQLKMTLECGPGIEITGGDFNPNAERSTLNAQLSTSQSNSLTA
ncbi:MAG TPA: hypothetical protein PLG22_07260 [Kiritimatiellia bacterium]|nr:hypothetical protein [Kiritimatiellia bacterium]